MISISNHSASSESLSGVSSWDQRVHTSRSSSIASSSSRMNGEDEISNSRSKTSPAATPLQTPLDTRERDDPLAISLNSKITHCTAEFTMSPTPGYEKPNPLNSAHQTRNIRQGGMSMPGDRGTTPTTWGEVRQSLSLSSVVGEPSAREMEIAKICFFQMMKAVETTPMGGQLQRKDSGVGSRTD